MSIEAPARSRSLAGGDALRSGRDLQRLVLPAVIVAEVAALYLVLRGGGWVFDDNLSVELARSNGFTWDWLTANLFGHFEIAHRAMFTLQSDLMPIDYRWALVTMLTLVGVASYLLSRCVHMLTGDGWAPVVASAYFGVSVLLIGPLLWWSTGLEAFPTVVCDLLCLWAYLHYQSSPRARWIAISAGAIAVGLLFYEKPAYMPLYIVFIRLLVLNDDLRLRSMASALWRERAMWVAYAVVILGYVVLRETSGAGSIASQGSASLSAWIAFLRILWAQTLVPALFGLRVPATGLSHHQVVVAIALQVVVIAVVLTSIMLRRGAWRAWLTTAICIAATAILVGVGRLAGFGPTVGGDPRYLVDFAWLVPLMACLAFRGPRRAGAAPSRSILPAGGVPKTAILPAGRVPKTAILTAGVIVLCAYVVTSIVTATNITSQWQGHQGREWEQQMETSMAALRRAHPHPIVANDDAPWFMVESAFSPYNELSFILPAYHEQVQVDGPLDGPLFALDGTGRVQPAVITPVRTVFAGATGCTRADASGLRLVKQIPGNLNPDAGPYYLIVSYRSKGDVTVPVLVDRGTGYPGVPDVSAWLVGGEHRSLAWLGVGAPHALTLSIPRNQNACVTGINLVIVRAR